MVGRNAADLAGNLHGFHTSHAWRYADRNLVGLDLRGCRRLLEGQEFAALEAVFDFTPDLVEVSFVLDVVQVIGVYREHRTEAKLICPIVVKPIKLG